MGIIDKILKYLSSFKICFCRMPMKAQMKVQNLFNEEGERIITLNTLPLYHSGIVDHVKALSSHDIIAQRLGELGFVPGELVKVIAYGPLGKDPIAVEVGFTRFALRRSEACRVVLRQASSCSENSDS